jgi:hypothetical protein
VDHIVKPLNRIGHQDDYDDQGDSCSNQSLVLFFPIPCEIDLLPEQVQLLKAVLELPLDVLLIDLFILHYLSLILGP